jgi:chemosensory pili system protein ChpA (sensor histidine kinase/response regulator)
MMLHSGLQRVAIQVDELLGTHEVVVKNIGPQLARVVGIAGATVLGDGKIVLILNPVALSTRAPTISVGRFVAAPAGTTIAQEISVAEAVAPAVEVPAPEHAIHLPTVLVVDDSLTVRKVTSRLLAREGYQVVTAKDGVDALEQMTEIVPDVILSDIEMPRMDGFELARNIRADERLVRIPIVMISSRTADKHRSHAAELGVNHFLGKPYQEEELLGLIAEFLGHKH